MDSVYHISQLIQTIVLVSLGALCAGTCLAWTSPVLPQLTPSPNATNSSGALELSESERGTVGSMLAVGALVAALPAGFVAEKVIFLLTI